ncbi:MAG: LLM class flavin-dependent oxidoreductase [Candidatus Heimdallarchaeota archaeon]|nr:LLM class flavin-dependent oxidoreductase [Candidatus Heimdallarchaeota archaeon]
MKNMKLGVYIHGSSPFHPKESFDEYKRLTKYYENIGIETLWFADHLIRTPDPNKSGLFETWSLIAGLSTITDKIKFGTMVTPITYRNIGVFAKMISTIDHMSKGRIIVGLGTGWYNKEHQMFNINYPTLKQRFVMLEDYVKGLLALWMSEDTVEYQSDSIELNAAYLNPQSYQRPHPPILIGGSGEQKTLKLVAKYAQMSNFSGNNETLVHKLSILKGHCEAIGRDFNEITPTTNMAAIIGLTKDEVEEGIKNYRKRFVELGMRAPAKETFAKNRLVGTPEEVCNRVKELENLGIKAVNITINDSKSEQYLSDVVKLYYS